MKYFSPCELFEFNTAHLAAAQVRFHLQKIDTYIMLIHGLDFAGHDLLTVYLAS
jgi:hypothetical protein